jgi:hypothetical protein
VVKPFFRDHFARIDRQVVLMDVLGAIHAGPPAVEDMRRAMADILTAFRPGRAGWLAQLLGARRVERILFAATKADHLNHDPASAPDRDHRRHAARGPRPRRFRRRPHRCHVHRQPAHHDRGNHPSEWRGTARRARHG